MYRQFNLKNLGIGGNMKTIVGIRLKKPGKIYYFDPGELKLDIGEFVIVETALGEEYAEVAIANREMEEEKIVVKK